jgi:predicted nuclease of restriction endonuclease-like (RecB) superfamily
MGQPDSTQGFERLVSAIQQTHDALTEHASKAVNLSLTLRNWFIGCYIAEFEQSGANRAAYGDRLLDDISNRLLAKGMSGVAARSLRQYRQFYLAYPLIWQTPSAKSFQALLSGDIWQTLSARLPADAPDVASAAPALQGPTPSALLARLSFSHFAELITLEDPLQRSFYEVETLRGDWSVRELKRQIATQYYARSNLSPSPDALSQGTQAQVRSRGVQSAGHGFIRDPYVFEFLGLKPHEAVNEGQLEEALLDKLQAFLLELGHGFCFEARQKRLLIGGEHFFVDLVFYHRVLKCHVLIELKNDAFQHQHLGQLNTYVSYYRQHEMSAGDEPPVGILLCTAKNHELVEFALAGMANQLFVSRYQVQLPGKELIEAFLQRALEELAR